MLVVSSDILSVSLCDLCAVLLPDDGITAWHQWSDDDYDDDFNTAAVEAGINLLCSSAFFAARQTISATGWMLTRYLFTALSRGDLSGFAVHLSCLLCLMHDFDCRSFLLQLRIQSDSGFSSSRPPPLRYSPSQTLSCLDSQSME